jgi:hypothetical protein
VVFKYPLDLSKNYVKRLVGMPGERLAVADGNLWVTTEPQASERPGPWRILRKPLEVQEDLWKRVYEWEDPRTAPEKLFGMYHPRVSRGSWRRSSEGMRTEKGEPFRFLFPEEGSIRDAYKHGYSPELAAKVQSPRVPTGQNSVGDLRFELELTPDSEVEELELIIRAPHREHRFRLAGPAATERSGIVWNRRLGTSPSEHNPTAESDFRLSAGERTEVVAEACDQRLRLLVDGEEIARVEYDRSWSEFDQGPLSSSSPDDEPLSRVEFGLNRGCVQVARIAVLRDIHYLPPLPESITGLTPEWAQSFKPLQTAPAPADGYFMMGDNTQNSLDSRGWQEVAMASLNSGETIVGNWNPDGGNPDHNPHPSRDDPEQLILRSRAGFEHRVTGPHDKRNAPYVKREFIVGKALLVFWPVPPFAIESRWKFIR